MRPPRLPALVRRELEGLDWSLVPGGRHWKLRIGKDFVGIYPFGASFGEFRRSTLGMRSTIRRWKEANRHAA